MEKKLHHIEIHPGKNGGHRVVHEYERRPAKRDGAMSGGMYMERPEPEEHLFGEGEDQKVMAHVAKALGFRKGGSAGGAKDETAEDDE